MNAPYSETSRKASEAAAAVPVLHFENVGKSFHGVKAVSGVTFSVGAGSVLGIVGENGAGKSTLMNLLGGLLRPDAGQISIDGEPYTPHSPRDARKHGVAFIHQELNLFTNLSVAENIYIEDFPRRAGFLLDRRAMHQGTRAVLQEVGLEISPNARLDSLTTGERQLVEIAKAMTADARIIIFDEPTTSLTERETEKLFRIIGKLRDSGRSIIYISHILKDVLRLSDHIVVMRDGELVSSGPVEDYQTGRLISLMVGRDIDNLFPERSAHAGQRVLLQLRNVSQPGIVEDISLKLHSGEVLGMFGLMGSGRSELARILFGLDPFDRGEIEIDGQPVKGINPRSAIRQGLAFVTEDRREEGLMMDASIVDNIGLVTLEKYSSTPIGLLSLRRLFRQSTATGEDLRIKAASLRQPVRSLSGGNQQKVVLGKWLASSPQVFILDEPTRGIDVGAKFEVYTLIQKLASQGAGILIISSELEELSGVSDRILVMHNGEIRREFRQGEFNSETILAAAFGEEQ